MRRMLCLAAMLLIATPAVSAECRRYVSEFDLGSIQFGDDGNATLTRSGLSPVPCGYSMGDEGGNDLSCEDGTTEQFAFASATYGGADKTELLILEDHVWYRRCE